MERMYLLRNVLGNTGRRHWNMDAARKEENYTIEDIYALPEGKRAELIDGNIYYMAPPSTKHQRLLNDVNTEINLHIRESGGKCEVFPAPFAVFLDGNDKNYVEPDISVVCGRDKITEKGCQGPPDWVIEIVSPSSRKMDYFKKLFKYRTSGVREYWAVDLEKEMVTVYHFELDNMEEYPFGQHVPVGIYEGFSIKVPEQFSDTF